MILPKLSTILTSALIYSSAANLQAQLQEPYTFQHIENGMSQSSATVLLEDSYGFIWVGTRNGLNKYDGTDFQIFEKSVDGVTGLTDEYIGALYEDGLDLYIGTDQGLSVYDRTLKRVSPYHFKELAKEIESKNIISIAKTENTLWLGTSSDGLYAYQTKTGKLRHFLANEKLEILKHSNHNILKVTPLDGERLLVVSSFNIFVIDTDLNILNKVPVQENITSVAQFDEMNFVIGTSEGSIVEFKISPTSEMSIKKTSISPGFLILSLAKDKSDAIWIGTENNGLFIYSKDTGDVAHLKYSSARPNSISNNSIWSLLSARNGVMWISCFKSGLSFYDSEYYKFKHINTDPFDSSSLSNRLVNAFKEDSAGNIWVGTDGGGLNYWNRVTDTFDHYSLNDKNFAANVVLSILQTKDDELWVGSWGNGIIVFNTVSKEFHQWNTENSFLKSNYISDLLRDKKGRIWIVNYNGGVQVYTPDTDSHTDVILKSAHDGSEITSAYTILEDNAGQVWIGTLNAGLFRLTAKKDTWKIDHFHNIDGKGTLSNNFVNTIVQDKYGTLWVGTQGGLNQYLPKSNSFRAITKANGLKNDAIKSILIDGRKHLWLGTERGIAKYDTATETVLDYDMKDGLQSNEFNAKSALKTVSGEFLFGGSNGFNIFRPEDVVKSDDAPKLFISGLKIFNKPVLPNDESAILKKDISHMDSITLDYNQSVIHFNFKTLTFRHPEKVNYAYFLEGFETDWNYVGNTPAATYTNLNPGEYILRIKSTNSDGVWVANDISLAITINPPFWKTWWFRTLLSIAFLGIIYLLYFFKVRNIKRHQIKLEQQIDDRTQELQLQKKKLADVAEELSVKNDEIQRFTYSVSHDLKSPLNSIQVMADLISMDVEEGKITDAKECLGYITQSCTIMNSLIADITEIAKLGKIENKMEILDSKEIIRVASNMAIGRLRERKAQLIVEDALPNIYGDRNRFVRVFENLIDNAIKYMGEQEKPVVAIKTKVGQDFQQFFISDNGSGMDAKSLDKLFTPFKRFHAKTKGTGLGLYMVRKIVVSHGGTITAASEGKGKGTTFTLTLPKADNTVQKALGSGEYTAV